MWRTWTSRLLRWDGRNYWSKNVCLNPLHSTPTLLDLFVQAWSITYFHWCLKCLNVDKIFQLKLDLFLEKTQTWVVRASSKQVMAAICRLAALMLVCANACWLGRQARTPRGRLCFSISNCSLVFFFWRAGRGVFPFSSSTARPVVFSLRTN